MDKLIYILTLFCLAFGLFSCADEPNFPPEPEIDFISIGNTVLKQGLLDGDTTIVVISFQDGDGDIGGDSVTIFRVDTRTDFIDSLYRVVEIPLDGVSNSISGEIEFVMTPTCCIYENGQIPCTPSSEFPEQELIYEIFLEDRAGNRSNSIALPPITLLCN